MEIRKAIFAINSNKSKAFLVEEISLENYPAEDSFIWWNGVQLVVATTNEYVVNWVVDGNPYLRIVEEHTNEYYITKVEYPLNITNKCIVYKVNN